MRQLLASFACRSARRAAYLGACLSATLLMSAAAQADDWAAFKSAHLSKDGAVTDDHAEIVHSEGQSYAMLLAVKHGDKTTFDAAWSFAKTHLRRDDGLFSWKYQDGQVADENNASDAEIVMAWALVEAAKAWGGPYMAEASDLLTLIRARLIVERPDPADPERSLLLILPGVSGFAGPAAAESENAEETALSRTDDPHGPITLNPSYWVFPAFDAFAGIDDPLYWSEVARSGERLIELAGARGLTPDWLSYPSLDPAPGFSSRSSYDALRVPLWLAWSGRASPSFAAWRQLWHERQTAWINSTTGEIAPYAPGPEQLAVLALLDRVASAPGVHPSGLPAIGIRTPYYAAAIVQLARLAWKERFAE